MITSGRDLFSSDDSKSKLLHLLSQKHFDHASLVYNSLLIQYKGREMQFPNLKQPWHIIKVAVERDVQDCIICQDAKVHMGCIFCGFGYCLTCVNHMHCNPMNCTVCKASIDINDGDLEEKLVRNIFLHVEPRFQIEYIYSFDDAEQEIGEMHVVLRRGVLYLHEDENSVGIRTLIDLICTMLNESNEEVPLPKGLWRISTCVKYNSIYPEHILTRIPILDALFRRNGKFMFRSNVRNPCHEQDKTERAIVRSAIHIFRN
jgi:hypothetical protein